MKRIWLSECIPRRLRDGGRLATGARADISLSFVKEVALSNAFGLTFDGTHLWVSTAGETIAREYTTDLVPTGEHHAPIGRQSFWGFSALAGRGRSWPTPRGTWSSRSIGSRGRISRR